MQDRTSFGFEFPWHANVPPAQEVSTLLPCRYVSIHSEERYSCFPQKILGKPDCNRIVNSSLDQDIEVALPLLDLASGNSFCGCNLEYTPECTTSFSHLSGLLTQLIGTLRI